jgi:hypothetical protein
MAVCWRKPCRWICARSMTAIRDAEHKKELVARRALDKAFFHVLARAASLLGKFG